MAIKKLQSDLTTPEQSERLLELGVPADSANYAYDCSLIGGEKYYSLSILEDELFSVYKRMWKDSSTDIIPCWSVGRLIEIWNICVNLMPGMDLEFSPSSNSYIEDLVRDFEFAGEDSLIDFSKLED